MRTIFVCSLILVYIIIYYTIFHTIYLYYIIILHVHTQMHMSPARGMLGPHVSRRSEMEEAQRRLARFDAELEKQRNGLQRHCTCSTGAVEWEHEQPEKKTVSSVTNKMLN